MRQLVKNYTFSTAAKTITLTDYTGNGVVLERILLIFDATLNVQLYNFADKTVAQATVATNVITLSALPVGVSNGDKLSIFYDNQTNDPTYDIPPTQVTNFPASQAVTGTFYQATQPVSGTVTVANPTANPETGLAKDGSLTTLNTSVNTLLKPASTLTKVTTVDTITNPVAVTGTFYPVTQPVSLATAPTTPVTGTFWQATQPISGTVTETNSTAIKADTDKIPSQGQALAAASTPVVLPATQITALTPPSNTGYGLTGSTVPTTADYTGVANSSGNLAGVLSAYAQADAAGDRALSTGGMVYNGSTWDRARGDTTNGAWVNVKAGTVGTTSAVINVGQKTVNTTAVQVSAVSTVPTNGVIIRALSTNAASIFVGGSGVTTSTGFELVAGESMSFTCNLNTLYIISVASTTDKCCWNVE